MKKNRAVVRMKTSLIWEFSKTRNGKKKKNKLLSWKVYIPINDKRRIYFWLSCSWNLYARH